MSKTLVAFALLLAGVAVAASALLSWGEKGEPVAVKPMAAVSQAQTELLNINTANVQQLVALPGIGEVKAQAVVDYRTENGRFASIEDIKQVDGIGEKLFEQIKNSITT